MDYLEYIKPELIVLAIVLSVLGMMFKKTPKISDWLIPYVLTVISIIFSIIYVLSTSDISSFKNIMSAIFTAFIQGILCVGLSVYGNQLFKQIKEKKE